MTDPTETERTTDERLAEISALLQKQLSFRYTIQAGIIYGIGFVIGSSILATILINLSFVFFGDTTLFQMIVDLTTKH